MSEDTKTGTATLSEQPKEPEPLGQLVEVTAKLLDENREELRKVREERNNLRRINTDLEVEVAHTKRLLREQVSGWSILTWVACALWVLSGAAMLLGPWIAWLYGFRFHEVVFWLTALGVAMLFPACLMGLVWVDDEKQRPR